MPEMNIDLERVISDPAYRRTVLDYLKSEGKSESDGEAARRAAPAQATAAAPSKQSAPTK
jgi:hypothetical protein